MSTRNIFLLAILAFIVIFGGFACNGYNGLVKLDENVNLMWKKVESDYQRRLDLIPNLVNTVKGAANFEKETLTGIVEARAKATSVQISSDNLTPEKLAEFQRAQAGAIFPRKNSLRPAPAGTPPAFQGSGCQN